MAAAALLISFRLCSETTLCCSAGFGPFDGGFQLGRDSPQAHGRHYARATSSISLQTIVREHFVPCGSYSLGGSQPLVLRPRSGCSSMFREGIPTSNDMGGENDSAVRKVGSSDHRRDCAFRSRQSASGFRPYESGLNFVAAYCTSIFSDTRDDDTMCLGALARRQYHASCFGSDWRGILPLERDRSESSSVKRGRLIGLGLSQVSAYCLDH